MEKIKFSAASLCAAALAVLLAGGCASTPASGIVLPTYKMVAVPAGTVTADTGDGPFASAGAAAVSVAAFKIGETEVTYELWYAVRQWAVKHGYTFANDGREGGSGTDGAAPTAKKTEPVTAVGWRSAVAWCNAYSEAAGKTPVYYEDEACTTVVKASGNADKAYRKADAGGFRLPTEAEWEYAARGGRPSEAAWSYTYAGTGDPKALENYAWYSGNAQNTTHPVKEKAANSASLYDMSGNVWELCWEPYAAPEEARAIRGGGWIGRASGCEVAYRYHSSPDFKDSVVGFRVVCP